MKKSDIGTLPQFFDKYIHLTNDVELTDALKINLTIPKADIEKFHKLKNITYAPGKWTVKDILQHVIDTERIQAYRALRIARKDKTLLPGFDESLFGSNAHAEKRSIEDLIEEQKTVRQSTIALFNSFSEDSFFEKGICFNVPISVLSLGFVMVGHQIHHRNILEERYFPLIES